jgi:uncharacterized sporulation protein YeaH/YhbH (DUF444 family)
MAEGDQATGQQGGEGGAGGAAGAPQSQQQGGGAQGGQGAGTGAQDGQGTGSPQGTETPGSQAGGFKLDLTDAQRKALLDGKPLDLAPEQYTAGVRGQIEAEKRKRTAAERELAKIVAAQEEAERKALVEQEKFKELYEKEAAAHETTRTARTKDLIRARFDRVALQANVIDPDVAFLAAQSMPIFADVKITEAGTISGVEDLVKALAESKPYLVSSQSKSHSVGGASNPGGAGEPPPPKNLAEAGDRLEQMLRSGQV